MKMPPLFSRSQNQCLGRQGLVFRIVLEMRVQRLAEEAALHDGAHDLAKRVVAHDQVHGEKAAFLPAERDHRASIIEIDRERFFA
ncbi:MAG: hypothetical protein M3463_08145 [Verrucomicrobiota bacterium]|nr:hypothetical protein [Verrucomicrobiota bacterium]